MIKPIYRIILTVIQKLSSSSAHYLFVGVVFYALGFLVGLPGLIRNSPPGVYKLSGGSEITIARWGIRASPLSVIIEDPFNKLYQGFLEDGDNKPLCASIAKALFEAKQGGLNSINVRTLSPNGTADYVIKFTLHNGFGSSPINSSIFPISYTFLDRLAEFRR